MDPIADGFTLKAVPVGRTRVILSSLVHDGINPNWPPHMPHHLFGGL